MVGVTGSRQSSRLARLHGPAVTWPMLREIFGAVAIYQYQHPRVCMYSAGLSGIGVSIVTVGPRKSRQKGQRTSLLLVRLAAELVEAAAILIMASRSRKPGNFASCCFSIERPRCCEVQAVGSLRGVSGATMFGIAVA